jgi:hypothetical protein
MCYTSFFLDRINRLLVGNPLQPQGGGGGEGFFMFHVIQHSLSLKMSDERASLRDPKGKSPLVSRGEKHQRELEARGKPTQHYAGASGSTNNADRPSKECKAAVFQALYKWFKDTLFTHINRFFLALRDVVQMNQEELATFRTKMSYGVQGEIVHHQQQAKYARIPKSTLRYEG